MVQTGTDWSHETGWLANPQPAVFSVRVFGKGGRQSGQREARATQKGS
jgi:hypothetical protein